MVIADSDYEGAAIQSLGSLFNVTQVFLWDDGVPVQPSSEAHHNHHKSNPIPDWSEIVILPEDLELNKQMNELGLPLSFQTNKKEKCGPVKGKKKGARSKLPRTCNNPGDETLNEVSAEEVISPAKFHNKTNSSLSCISMLGQSEPSFCDGAVEVDTAQSVSGEGDNSTVCTGFADGVFVEKINSMNNAETNDANNSDFDFKRVHASETGVSAGSHLTDCETICNDDGAATWNPSANESESLSMSLEEIGCDRVDGSNDCGEFRDWMVLWDTFYGRRYFYNVKTDTSTWDPPPGMEHLAFGGFTELDDSEALKSSEECETQRSIKALEETLVDENLSGNQHEEYSAEIGVAAGNLVSDIVTNNEDQSLHHSDENLESGGVSCCSVSNTPDHFVSTNDRCSQATSEVNHTPMENMVIDAPGLDSKSDNFMSKQKKKVKRKHRRKKLYYETEELEFQKMPDAYSATIEKYWCQRYILFSRFDDGVNMDEEGWFSVTPEVIAHHQASRCASGTVIDCFTGVGGNAIQFAQRCNHVIAIDIDPLKIGFARHNAAIYRVDDLIDFIIGDFFVLAPKLKADTVFLSPPWGGPDYAKVETYDMKTMLRPHDGYTLFNAAKEIASRVVMFLPRNVNFNQLAELSLSACPPWSLEVEKVHLNGKLKAVTAYFSRTPVGEC
ncbi:S-adenosyl-L-methionine-dependent methyltransferase superfamily protein [Trifolium repens]|nr:S-adenosyl-L-methionine-dependent methyltransferase superfamily protein [Trifolium repens]